MRLAARQPTTRLRTAALVEALRRPRYEVLPVDGIDEEVAAYLPREVSVTVTASPRRGLDLTITHTERLRRLGYDAVPHLAARQIVDMAHLAEILGRLDHAGVRDAFVVAGDRPVPAGQFPDTLTLLTAMKQISHRIERIGIAGYPDGHPFVSDAELTRVLMAKAPYANYLVSQLCFDHRTIATWVARLRAACITLPVYVGVAGVVDRRRLLRIATKIGAGTSARFLREHRRPLLRLAGPKRYRPDRQVAELADSLDLDGLHFYTFNALRATEQARQRLLAVAP